MPAYILEKSATKGYFVTQQKEGGRKKWTRKSGVIAKNNNKSVLLEISENLRKNFPRVLLVRSAPVDAGLKKYDESDGMGVEELFSISRRLTPNSVTKLVGDSSISLASLADREISPTQLCPVNEKVTSDIEKTKCLNTQDRFQDLKITDSKLKLGAEKLDAGFTVMSASNVVSVTFVDRLKSPGYSNNHEGAVIESKSGAEKIGAGSKGVQLAISKDPEQPILIDDSLVSSRTKELVEDSSITLAFLANREISPTEWCPVNEEISSDIDKTKFSNTPDPFQDLKTSESKLQSGAEKLDAGRAGMSASNVATVTFVDRLKSPGYSNDHEGPVIQSKSGAEKIGADGKGVQLAMSRDPEQSILAVDSLVSSRTEELVENSSITLASLANREISPTQLCPVKEKVSSDIEKTKCSNTPDPFQDLKTTDSMLQSGIEKLDAGLVGMSASHLATSLNANTESSRDEDSRSDSSEAISEAEEADNAFESAFGYPPLFVGAEEIIEYTVNSPVNPISNDTEIGSPRRRAIKAIEPEEIYDDDDNWSTITELDKIMMGCDLANSSVNPVLSSVSQEMSPEIVRTASKRAPSRLNDTLESTPGCSKNVTNGSFMNSHSDLSLPEIETSRQTDKSYVLSEDSSEGEDVESEEEIPDQNDPTNTALRRQSLNTTDPSIARGAIEEDALVVISSRTQKKLNFCYYCKTLQTVISRHIETVHRDEPEVKKFSHLKKGDAERRKIIETLRLNGNYIYNTNPLYNKGDLIVPRQPSARMKRTAKDFRPCHNCKGYFSKTSIRRHRQRCIGESSKHHRSNTILSRKIAGRLHEAANSQLKNVIFPVFREDDVVRNIRVDKLLVLFGNKLASKYKQQQQHEMIRARLRHLGRLLRTVRSLKPEIDCFATIYRPKYYDTVVRAINIEAGYDEEKNEYATPSVASSIGNYLKKVGKFYIIECIKNEDNEAKENAERFLQVHEEEFCAKVNKLAVELTIANNRKKKKPLPSMDDIQKLRTYLTQKWNEYYEELVEKYSYETWLNLLQVTLISVQLFTRRRAGEIERVKIEDLKNYEKIDATADKALFASLSREDQVLATKYVRFEVLGKLGRNVAVLLSMDMLKGIELILDYRPRAKVHPGNPYVFGIPGFDKNRYKHLRACNLMRLFAVECGAEHPERLRGTTLRKHMATKCAESNIDENKICDIANFMGHAEKVHRDHYRKPVAQRDLCGISRLLETAVGLDQELDHSDVEKELVEPIQKRLNDSEVSDGQIHTGENVNRPIHLKSKEREKVKKSTQKLRKRTKKKGKVHDDEEKNSVGMIINPKEKLSTTLGKQNRKRTHPTTSNSDSDYNDTSSNSSNEDDSECDSGAVDRGLAKKCRKVSGSTSGKTTKVRWTAKEKEVTMKAFKIHIAKSKLPTAAEICAHIESHKKYLNRTEAQVRTWVSNQIIAKKRKLM